MFNFVYNIFKISSEFFNVVKAFFCFDIWSSKLRNESRKILISVTFCFN